MAAGFDGKILYNTGSFASPTWVEVTVAKDVSVPLEIGVVDSSNRGSKYKKHDVALIDLTVEFSTTYRQNETTFVALKAHALARTTVELAICDGPIATAGTQGWRMPCKLTSMALSQPLEDSQTIDWQAKPTYDATAGDPSWFTTA